jgi:hypothetical protein
MRRQQSWKRSDQEVFWETKAAFERRCAIRHAFPTPKFVEHTCTVARAFETAVPAEEESTSKKRPLKVPLLSPYGVAAHSKAASSADYTRRCCRSIVMWAATPTWRNY